MPAANRAKKHQISPFKFGRKGETGDLMSRSLKLITILAFATLAVSACGKRGALEAPPSEDGKTSSSSVQPKANEKPHRPFVLDGLLR
jgi:predicted small lipoprotein YifL